MPFKFNPCRAGQHCCGALSDTECLYMDSCFNCSPIPFTWFIRPNGMSNECSEDINLNNQLSADYQGDGLCLWNNTYGASFPISWLLTLTVGIQGNLIYVSIITETNICNKQAIYSINKNSFACFNNNTLNYETPGVNFVYTYPEFNTHGATLLLSPANKVDLPNGHCPCPYYSHCFSRPIYYSFTLSDVELYYCGVGTGVNRDWLITNTGDCTWFQNLFSEVTSCHYNQPLPSTATLYFDNDLQNYYLVILVRSCPFATCHPGGTEEGTLKYKLSRSEWSCLGQNTLQFDSVTNNNLGVPFLTSYPMSVTITPV